MSENALKINQSLCPLCGKTNRCAVEIETETRQKQPPCWCVTQDFSANLLATLPKEAQGTACICKACAEQTTASP